MALSENKIEMFAQYLTEDKDRAEKLFELSPEDVVKIVAKDGIELTTEEVVEFGEKLKSVAAKDGELDATELDDVSGGLGPVLVPVMALGGIFVARSIKRW